MTLGPRDDDLAVGARWAASTPVVASMMRNSLPGEGYPHGAGARGPAIGLMRGGAGALGQSVALDERESVARLEPGQQLRRGGRGAADAEPHR